MTRWTTRPWAALWLVLAACGGPPEAETGVVVTIDVDDRIEEQVGSVVFTVGGVDTAETWREDLTLTDLPLNLGVVPGGTTDLQELSVEALPVGAYFGSEQALSSQRVTGAFDEGRVRWVRVRLWADGCTREAQRTCLRAGGRICCGGICEVPRSFDAFPEWPGKMPDTLPEEAHWCAPPQASAEDFVALDAGYGAYCGVQVSGRVRCWGNITWPGDTAGIVSGKARPVPLPGGEKATMVAVGYQFACAVTEEADGPQHVRCWGSNSAGQLGQSPDALEMGFAEVALPTDVGRIEEIDAGFSFVCVRTDDGRVSCWGDNSRGQLGTEPTGGFPPGDVGSEVVPQPVPLSLPLPDGVVTRQLALGGWHGCLLADEGTRRGQILCWGSREAGQLGDGPFADGEVVARPTPVRPVAPDRSVVVTPARSLASTFMTSCALTADNMVYCWGLWPQSVAAAVNWYPQQVVIRSSGTFDATEPEDLALGGLILARGRDLPVTLCLRTARGAVGCLGSGGRGQLGYVGVQSGFVADGWNSVFWGAVDRVALGGASGCALQSWGRVVCWGDEQVGQLARGGVSGDPRPLPAPIVLDDGP